MKKRILSVVVLLSILVSCGTSPKEPVETAAETPDAAAVTQEETVPETNAPEEPVLPDVPERDYAGAAFQIYTRGEQTGKFWHKDLAAEHVDRVESQTAGDRADFGELFARDVVKQNL